MKKMWAALFILFCSFPLPTFADLAFNGVSINGFISQGYVISEGYDLYLTDTQDGSFEFNELGLTFTSIPMERLRSGPTGRQLRLNKIRRIGVFSPGSDEPFMLFFSDFRLVNRPRSEGSAD